MLVLKKISSAFRSLFGKQKLDRELDDELRSYVGMMEEENVKKGMSSEQARREAQLSLGGAEQVKERVRDARIGALVDTILQDIRYGIRGLIRRPGFTLVATLTLALGIGANASIFSLINAVWLKNLPVKDPQSLVLLNWESGPFPRSMVQRVSGYLRTTDAGLNTSTSFSYPVYEIFRDQNEVFSDTFAFAGVSRINLGVDGQAELAAGQLVSGEFFRGLGIGPYLGRLIRVEDDDPQADPVAVITYGYWQRRFGGLNDVIGKAIYVNSSPFTIVGVAPPEFKGTLQVGSSPWIFVPMAHQVKLTKREDRLTNIRYFWHQIMGRLKPGTTRAEAQVQLDLMLKQFVASNAPETETADPEQERAEMPSLVLTSGARGLHEEREDVREPVTIALIISGLVLLIACANVANLLLARGSVRRKEMAVRLSLGAGRMRLLRQLLTESTLVALLGGTMGLLIAYWGGEAILATFAEGSSTVLDVRVDVRVLGFALGLSLITVLLFGLVPSMRSSGITIAPALKQSIAGYETNKRSRLGMIRGLLMAQVAISLFLLVIAGLFIQTLRNLGDVDPGFNTDKVLVFRMDPTLSGYEGNRLAELYMRLQEGIESIPGVRSATVSEAGLLAGYWSITDIYIHGFTPGEDEDSMVFVHAVDSSFLKTMEIPLILGRNLEPGDNRTSAKVGIINETLAQKYLGDKNPVGQRFGLEDPDNSSEVEIVGVVKDHKNARLRETIRPTVYLPYVQNIENLGGMSVSVRTRQDPAAIVASVRRKVADLDANIPLYNVKSLVRQIEESKSRERLYARLSGLLGVIALGLTCIGLYGILTFTVAQRTQEIGIRMTLGARRLDVCKLIMREMLLVIFGSIIGLGAAIAGTRILSSSLFGLSPTDPATLLAAVLLLIGVAAISVSLPARQAASVDPVVALRYE